MFNLKNCFKTTTSKVVSGVAGSCAFIFPVICHADTPAAPDVSSVVTTSINNCVTQTLQCIAALAPLGLTIFAVTFCFRKSVDFFRKSAQ